MKPWFVTATGTDLGKTHVLCLLLEGLRRRGVGVQALKPVLSGFAADDLPSTDSGRLLAAAGASVDLRSVSQITPWRFLPALSPDMAARRAGFCINLDEVASFCLRAIDGERLTFVEGAGGIMSPLGTGFLNVDLALRLNARVLLVAGGYLGTISHTLTAMAALSGRGIRVEAIVLSGAQPGPVPLEETRDSILAHVSVPVFCVERGGGVSDRLLDLVMA
jgi:dethiobiotin synthetase